MTISQVQSPYSFSLRKSYLPHANVLPNKWFWSENEGSNSCFKEFEVNNLAIQRWGTTIILHGWIGTCQKSSGGDIEEWRGMQYWRCNKRVVLDL